MRCHKARKYISEYVDGTLEPRKAGELERHVEKCAACREILADFRAMVAAASDLETPEPGDAVWLKIRSRLPALAAEPAGAVRVPERRAFGRGVPALRLAGAAALAFILVAVGVYLGVRLGNRGDAAFPKYSEKYTLA
jgi:anti-sigma factor RsiW